jgi:hypothetical protein
MNAGRWLLLNSAGRCSAEADHTGVDARPSAVRRSAEYVACSDSMSGAWVQTIQSASARMPARS